MISGILAAFVFLVSFAAGYYTGVFETLKRLNDK